MKKEKKSQLLIKSQISFKKISKVKKQNDLILIKIIVKKNKKKVYNKYIK